MTIKELSEAIDDLRATAKVHGNLLATFKANSVTHTVQLETILWVLREVLAKRGVEKERSHRLFGEIFADHAATALAESERIRKSHKRFQPPTSHSASLDISQN
jgi:hypothetical protein